MQVPTVRIVAEVTNDNPLGFIVINESDFDKEAHTLFEGPEPEQRMGVVAATREQLDVTLATLPGEQTDPDYVVSAMRAHFGAIFTSDDEAKVRQLVMPVAPAAPSLADNDPAANATRSTKPGKGAAKSE